MERSGIKEVERNTSSEATEGEKVRETEALMHVCSTMRRHNHGGTYLFLIECGMKCIVFRIQSGIKQLGETYIG